MHVDNLRAFVSVYDQGSFSLAAEHLFVTQPAISKRVALLEEQLQTRLFDRMGRKINPTPTGNALYPRALAILSEMEDTQRAISNLSGNVSGQLGIATNHHIGMWSLPELLRDYTRRFPHVSLDLHFMDSAVAYDEILSGDLEVGVITLAPTPGEQFHSIPLWQDELKFVCAIDHPLAERHEIRLNDLSAYPSILPDLTTFTGRIVQSLFDSHELNLKVMMSTNYLETIKTLISVGLAWSVLPESMIDSTTCPLRIPKVEISRTLGIIHLEQRTLSNAAQEFVNLLCTNADQTLRQIR